MPLLNPEEAQPLLDPGGLTPVTRGMLKQGYQRPPSQIADSPMATVNYLAEQLYQPLAYMSPWYGDYLAQQDASRSYEEAGKAWDEGDYWNAFLHGARGFGDQLTTVPAFGEAAGLIKGASSTVLPAMIGAMRPVKTMRNIDTTRYGRWHTSKRAQGHKRQLIAKLNETLASYPHQSTVHRITKLLDESPRAALDEISSLKDVATQDLVTQNIVNPTEPLTYWENRLRMYGEAERVLQEDLFVRNPGFAESYAKTGWKARQEARMREEIASARGAHETEGGALSRGGTQSWDTPNEYTDEQFEQIRRHLSSQPHTVRNKVAVDKALMTMEGPKTPHRLRQRLMEVADTVPEERFADFSRSLEELQNNLPVVSDVGVPGLNEGDSWMTRRDKFGGENPRIGEYEGANDIFAYADPETGKPGYRRPDLSRDLPGSAYGVPPKKGEIYVDLKDNVPYRISNNERHPDARTGDVSIEVEDVVRGGYRYVKADKLQDPARYQRHDAGDVIHESQSRVPMSKEDMSRANESLADINKDKAALYKQIETMDEMEWRDALTDLTGRELAARSRMRAAGLEATTGDMIPPDFPRGRVVGLSGHVESGSLPPRWAKIDDVDINQDGDITFWVTDKDGDTFLVDGADFRFSEPVELPGIAGAKPSDQGTIFKGGRPIPTRAEIEARRTQPVGSAFEEPKQHTESVFGSPADNPVLSELLDDFAPGSEARIGSAHEPPIRYTNSIFGDAKRAEDLVLDPPRRTVDDDDIMNIITQKPDELMNMNASNRAIERSHAAAKKAGGERKIGKESYVGAPSGVVDAGSLKASDDQYLEYVRQGSPARDFYEDMQEANALLRHGDALGSERFAGAEGVTSQGTHLEGNYGFAVKGHNQAMVGDPVDTGRFTTEAGPKIEDIYAGKLDIGEIGPKTGPFAVHGAPGRSHSRAVHDIWDGRARGYVNKDGSQWDQGFAPSQHAFMDRQDERVVERLNREKVGGHADWTPQRAQAAAWAAKRVEAGEIRPDEMYARYGALMPSRRAMANRETVPGETTGHLRGLSNLPYEQKAAYHDEINSLLEDNLGRDKISQGLGALVEPNLRTVGVSDQWGMNPGTQTRVQVGQSKGTGLIDPASRKLMDAAESSYGLLTGQDAYAWGRAYTAKNLSEAGTAMADMGRAPTPDELKRLTEAVSARYGFDAFVTPTDTGFQIFSGPQGRWRGGKYTESPASGLLPMKDTKRGPVPDKKSFMSWVDEAIKPIVGDATITPMGYTGNFYENDWSKQGGRYGKNYVGQLKGSKSEPILGAFDDFAPGLAGALRHADERAAKEFGLDVSPDIQKMRKALEEGGLAGLTKLIKTGALPAVLVAATLPYLPQESLESPAM